MLTWIAKLKLKLMMKWVEEWSPTVYNCVLYKMMKNTDKNILATMYKQVLEK